MSLMSLLVQAHKLITKVLCSNPELGRSSPYVPTFYQLCDYISPSPSSEVSS